MFVRLYCEAAEVEFILPIAELRKVEEGDGVYNVWVKGKDRVEIVVGENQFHILCNKLNAHKCFSDEVFE